MNLRAELQEFLRLNNNAQRKSVIVVVNQSYPKLRLKRVFPKNISPMGKYHITNLDKVDPSTFSMNMQKVYDDLLMIGVSSKNVVRVNGAQAFVLDVTPNELRKIMEIPEVKSVLLNEVQKSLDIDPSSVMNQINESNTRLRFEGFNPS